jgi:hypothetical protein
MPDASLGEKLKNWRLLSEGLKLRIEEVPFLKEDHAELSALVQQIDSLMQQTDVHEGRLREAIRQRGIAEDRTAELYGRMVARLKGTYGKRSNLLHEIGLRPEAPPVRLSKKDDPEPPAPGTTPTQPPAPARASAEEEPTAG